MASILTNSSAMTALSVLRKTNDELSVTQSRISTGLKVGSAKDNASFWAVSQVMKSDVGAYKAIGDNLSLAQASTSVARDGAEKIADLISKIKGKVTSAQEGSLDKAKIQADVDSMLAQIGEISKSANFNGVNLLESSDTVKLLSSLGRSGSDVSASYISFDSQNLTLGADGGLRSIDGLNVLGRGDQVLENTTDGVSKMSIGVGPKAMAIGDEISISYNDEDGVARTFTYAVKQAISIDDAGAQKLVDELSDSASFSKLFAIEYDATADKFSLSAASRNTDVEITNWAAGAFDQPTHASNYGAFTLGTVGADTTDDTTDITLAYTDLEGNSQSLALNVASNFNAAALDTAITTALGTALGITVAAGDVTVVTNAGAGTNELQITSTVGKFGAITITPQGDDVAATVASATPTVTTSTTQTQAFEFKDEPLRLGEEISFNYTVAGTAKQVTFRVAGDDTASGVRLDNSSDPDKIVLALDARKVAHDTTTGTIIATEVKEALASLAGANAYGINNASAGFNSISTAATAGTDIGYSVSTNTLTLTTAAGTDSIQTATTPTTDYQALLDNIESAYTNALNAAAALGSAQARVDIQKDFVKSMVDNLNSGIGTLVDADMNEESARLQALQVQQQLGIQALSIANQQPQMVLSLFR